MASTYKHRYGFDWPEGMSDEFIGLVIGKKWREYKAQGVLFKDPWVPYMDALIKLFGNKFKRSPWAEQHVHDWVMEDYIVTWGAASSGKALLPSEPVYCADGPRPIGDIAPGDYVYASTGDLVRVHGVTRQSDVPLYRVSFDDGSSIVCTRGHLWEVRYWGRRKWEGSRSRRRAVMGYVTKVLPVERLAGWSNLRRRRASVPLTKLVNLSPRSVPLDPYTLGVLLGDASMTGTVLLTSAPGDSELRDSVNTGLAESCPGYGLVRVGSSKTSYMVVSLSGSRCRNPVVAALKSLGLYGHVASDKFIPELYKFNSADVRFGVLAGLFDTDGTVGKDGHASFTTISKQLALDVKFILVSLGASATISERIPVCHSGASRVLGKPAYTVYVRATDPTLVRKLFRLSRKRDRVHSSGRGVGRRGIVSVEEIRDRQNYSSGTVCLTLDKLDVTGAPANGLFLAGRDLIVTHNSNDTGALAVTDWVVDPYDTTTLIGSTTKDALRIRTWESVERYFALLKSSAKFYVPGKITQTGYSILNDRDNDNDPLAQGAKAGIHGVALNDGGKLQGAHSKYVRLIIDELATINNHDGKGGILETIDNLQITTDFKFSALANPEGWLDQSSQYCIPEGGVESVNVDTGSWRSTFGCFVRHHDGMKSICVQDPTKVKEFPYLTQKKHVDQALKRSNGNMDSPRFWKMIRGFPVPSGASGPVVLDPQVAVANCVSDPPPSDVPFRVAHVAAGVDPAWTEGGDGACYVRVRVLVDDVGRPLLDFTDGLRYLQINGSDRRPAVEQMRRQIIDIMSDRRSPQAMFRATAVDSSGNQGLADELQIHAGANCLKVNSSEAASDFPLRAGSSDPASKSVKDRGTESWTVLAEFCRARMVRGLPAEAVRALTTRRLATKPSGEALLKDTLEPKREFKLRFKHSPDECDACALAALAVKERLGVLPYGSVPRPPTPEYLVRNAPQTPVAQTPRTEDDYASDMPSDDFGGPSV